MDVGTKKAHHNLQVAFMKWARNCSVVQVKPSRHLPVTALDIADRVANRVRRRLCTSRVRTHTSSTEKP